MSLWNPYDVYLAKVTLGIAPHADFNKDGRVDAADLVQWRRDYGSNYLSDADNDGDSDGADLLVWQRQLGSSLSAIPAAGAVPEPSAAALAAAALIGFLALRANSAT
jgi:hypothetical protein